jgi:hypothetical protein
VIVAVFAVRLALNVCRAVKVFVSSARISSVQLPLERFE